MHFDSQASTKLRGVGMTGTSPVGREARRQPSARRVRGRFAAVTSLAAAVLAGCGGGAMAERVTAADNSQPAVQQGAEADGTAQTVSAVALPAATGGSAVDTAPAARSGAGGPTADEPPDEPQPTETADEPPDEPQPTETADEPRAAADGSGSLNSEDAPVSAEPGDEQRVPFSYWDGDDQITVYLQVDPPEAAAQSQHDAPDGGKTPSGLAAGAGPATEAGGDLVFVSEAGIEMRLPGGIVLLLDPDWSAAQVGGFFAEHGIARSSVSDLGWIDNGYFVDAAPGLPSLLLANSLVGLPGVEMSTPDWAFDHELQ